MRYLPVPVLLLAFIGAAHAAPPPVEAFGHIPSVENVALSPSGNLLAWQENAGNRQIVVVYNLERSKEQVKFNLDPGTKLRDVLWSDEGTLLLEMSITHTVQTDRKYRREWFRTLSANLATGKMQVLLMMDQDRQFVTGSLLLAARTGKPHSVTMSTLDWVATMYKGSAGTRLAGDREDSGWVHSVYDVDTRTGRGTVLAYGNQFTDAWVVDAAGQPVARSDWRPSIPEFSVHARDGKGWRNIHAQRDGGTLRLIGVSQDGSAVLAIGAHGQPNRKLWSLPFDGSGAKVLIEDSELDVTGVRKDPLTGAPVAVFLGGAEGNVRWLDKSAQSRNDKVVRAFPERVTAIVSQSADYRRVVASVESPSHPPVYYLVDYSTSRADIVGEAYPGLSEVQLGEMRSFAYKARDGAAIPAYLTLPPGVEPKRLPTVVLPHGGPESRDHYEFDWWAQFLASRGYAVLQPQFRGSIGFGEAHRLAGRQQWGGVMQDDVSDGVAHLIEQGIADASRVCIVGASYGGYSALAGAAFTPDLYVCAASINGVSDLPTMISHQEAERGDDSDAAYYWRDHIGTKGIAEKSPARAAAAVKATVLLVHGADDTVVPIAQSKKMQQALKSAGKPVQMVTLPGEDHWLSRSETRIGLLKELESFLGAHLAAPTATATAGSDTAAPPGN